MGCGICAGLAAGVAPSADMELWVEAPWAAFYTQPGALKLQEGRGAGPAGLRSRSRAQFTGVVTFLTAEALTVVPSGAMGDTEVEEAEIPRGTCQAVFRGRPRTAGTDVIAQRAEAQLSSISVLSGVVRARRALTHTGAVVEVFGHSTCLALIMPWSPTGLALAVAGLAGELVVMKEGSWRTLSVSCYPTEQCVWIQHQASLTLCTLIWLRPRAGGTGLMTFLAFHSRAFIVSPCWTVSGAHALVKLGGERRARFTVVSQWPGAAGTCGVALATAALLHVLIVTHGAAGSAHAIQNQIKETALVTSLVI